MFAVLKTGGKQYRVQAGDVLRVEKIAAHAGEKIQFNEVLMIGSVVGAPLVDGAAVQAEVVQQIKADKVITYVKRRRKHSSQRTRGHRQQLTLIRITDMLESGGDKSGVKAAIGARAAGGEWVGQGTDRFAMDGTDQAEMKARVASGEAGEKPAKAAKAAKKDAKAEKPAKEDKAAKPAKAKA
ncbi:MAG: 50S ribosomal protein L21, partial [Paracoccus sp. (in: a-proteobacteria)]|nr:50S ribosomal protein L21 [Paracoccus sp. (in: a-proteobacteria)]